MEEGAAVKVDKERGEGSQSKNKEKKRRCGHKGAGE